MAGASDRWPGRVPVSLLRADATAVIEALQEGHRRFPQRCLSEAEFREYVSASGHDLIAAPPPLIHLADLYLACAALAGEPSAVAAVLRSVEQVGRRALSATTLDLASDAVQSIRVRLFSPLDESPARLRQYRGSAALETWLRVIVVREYQKLAGTQGLPREVPMDVEAIGIAMPADTLLDDAHYLAAFKRAFQEEFSGLSIHDRTILKQHYQDGLGISKLATVRQVHRGTMARELAQIRHCLEQAVASRLCRELQVNAEDGKALHARVASKVDVSLSRLFDELPV